MRGGPNEDAVLKWWRKENDFADYELIDQFLEQLEPESEFEGFELLSMDDMLQELQRYASNRVWLEKTGRSALALAAYRR